MIEKIIKKCVKCGDLDYMQHNDDICSECLKKEKEQNKKLLEI